MPRTLPQTNISFFILLLGIFIKNYDACAQQTHTYTVRSGQPPLLVADAGEDLVAEPDKTVTLGGDPAASGGTAPYSYAWEPVAGLSDPELSRPEATAGHSDATYSLTVTDAAGCTATDEVKVYVEDISTPLATDPEKARYTVYPNPAHSWLVIHTGEAASGTLTLLDSRGKEVLKESVAPVEHRLDTRTLASGTYLLHLQVHQQRHTFRIVIF